MDARLAKNLCRSEARWREEVMPGGSSGEVRPTSSGSDACAYAPGGKMCQSANTGQAPSVPLCGHKIECIEKEHDETLDPLARKRELIILTVDGPRRPRSL